MIGMGMPSRADSISRLAFRGIPNELSLKVGLDNELFRVEFPVSASISDRRVPCKSFAFSDGIAMASTSSSSGESNSSSSFSLTIFFLLVEQAFGRRSVIRFHRIFAAEHGVVNPDASHWQMRCKLHFVRVVLRPFPPKAVLGPTFTPGSRGDENDWIVRPVHGPPVAGLPTGRP